MASASYTTVLVGTDGSESSFRAVDRAATIAGAAGATLLIVCAYHPMSSRDQDAARDQLGESAYKVSGSAPAEEVLRDAAGRAAEQGAKDVEQLPEQGDAVDVLVRLAKDRKADLVVVGNRGLNSLSGRLLGSVPNNISHKAHCDVLIVHTTGKSR